MGARTAAAILATIFAACVQAQTLTIAGGETTKSATKHDTARLEANFSWIPDLWSNESLRLSLNQSVSVAGFWDLNDVYLISWVPNLILTPADQSGFYPYLQVGLGLALLSDDKFESYDSNPWHEGSSDLGSKGQFENSLALGLARDRFSIRAKVYHYSNGGLAHPNGGMNVAEFGISYRLE